MRLVIFAAVLGTIGIIAVGLLRPAPASQSAKMSSSAGTSVGSAVGDSAPDFTLKALDGREVSLRAFRGRPLLLNFWYATCPGCLQEAAALQQFYARQQAAGKNFAMLGINSVDDGTTAASFVQRHGVTYPVVLDPNQQVETLYNLNATPTSYFIDRTGIIRAVIIGPVDETMLQQKLKQLDS